LRSELSSTSTIPPDYLHKNSDQYTGRKTKVIKKIIPKTVYRRKITRIISLLFLYFSPGGASDIHLVFRFESSEIVVRERAEVQLATIGAFKYHSVKSGWCLCGHYCQFVMTRMCSKCGFWNVSLMHSGIQIYDRSLIKTLHHARKSSIIGIFDHCERVQLSIVDTHLPCSILLFELRELERQRKGGWWRGGSVSCSTLPQFFSQWKAFQSMNIHMVFG